MCPFGHFMPSARSIGADLLRRARRVVLESARVARLDNEVPPVAVQACPVQHVVLSVVDGRGNLSEEALAEFTRFFLETCLEQVRFMENLVQPNRLRGRILLWAEEEVRAGALPAKAGKVLEAVLFRGELPRGDLPALLNTGDAAGAPDRLGAARARRPRIGEYPRAIEPHISGGTGTSLDARSVSREDDLRRRRHRAARGRRG